MTDTVAERPWMLEQRAKNFGASFLFISCAFLLYRFSPHTEALRKVWNDAFRLSGTDFLTGVYFAYSLLLLIFYLAEKHPHESKSIGALRAIRVLARSPLQTYREGLPHGARLGLLTVLLKGFFAPLMLLSLFSFTGNLINNGAYLLNNAPLISSDFLRTFNSHGFWFLFQLIVFADVAFFTVGYLIEHPLLKNEIRSVDPTWLGWLVALACYPPFNAAVGNILGGGVVQFPQFTNPVVHITMNALLLLLMAGYSWASVALNLKASNLTHRGIISDGPYRFVRHPAYVCKNMAWWIGFIPTVVTRWETSAWESLVTVGVAAAWSAVYVLRALTEEDHLRTVDGEYDAYCRKVTYRFLPGIY
jgi:protein-S-isoprenylcysteine O-methyltransferase Ste14